MILLSLFKGNRLHLSEWLVIESFGVAQGPPAEMLSAGSSIQLPAIEELEQNRRPER